MNRLILALGAALVVALGCLYFTYQGYTKAKAEVKTLTQLRDRDERANRKLQADLALITKADKETRNALNDALGRSPHLRDTALPADLVRALRM